MTDHGSEAPRVQGRFCIESEIARGGMATVFAALDVTSGQRVALKRLDPRAPKRMATLFEREFYVLSSLRHPRIVDVYEYGIDAAGPFYTMELLSGADLRELAPMPPSAACRHIRDVASSLALLHARRLLHRDVSPRNVRTLPSGGCKLIDFGALTSFGTSEDVVGTPPAIAPEVLAGQPLDQRADLYSLGALAYFLLTGLHAYPARTVRALPDAWTAPPLPPSAYAPDVPAELDELVLALLNLDALGRPASAAEVIERLNGIAGLPPEHDVRVAHAYLQGTPLLEREHERRKIERCIRHLQQGRGSALLICGESGIGKTRLLSDLALKAQLAGLTVLRATAGDQAGPLMTARALVQQALRLLPHVASAIFQPHAALFRSLWDANLSGLDPREPEPNAADENVPALLEAAFSQLAQHQPLVIAVDDIEEADPGSAALLMALSRRARTGALLVVTTLTSATHGTSPPATSQPESAAIRNIREAALVLTLQPLTERGTLGIVQAAFGDVPHTRRAAQRLFSATRGNPEHCMQLLQRWLDDDLVRYVGGSFSLPLEIPELALLAAEQVARDALLGRTHEALTVARVLALLHTPLLMTNGVELVEPLLGSRAVILAIEELSAAGVLVQSAHGLRFRHELLRAATLDTLDEDTRRALQRRIGEHLLTAGDDSFEGLTTAGLHILLGGEEQRGASIIARAASAALAADVPPAVLAKAKVALEAALASYRRSGRSRLEQLTLLVPMTVASYEISPAFAERYGATTLQLLVAALGLRTDQVLADDAAVMQLLMGAPVLEAGEQKTADTPNAVTLLGWLIHCVASLTAVASAAIDHEAEARAVEPLRPFRALDPMHPATFVYEYCQNIIGMTQEHPAQSHRAWSVLLERLPKVHLPPNVLRRLRYGALFALGLLECQRDDDSALARLAVLDDRPTLQASLMADQLRFLYHAFRGRHTQAEYHRDRVETHAVQYGSAWQAEIWASSTATAVYALTRDATGIKRVTEQLERLQRDIPSLHQYWERAQATQWLYNDAPQRAAELIERTLARSGPRERVGWCAVRGALARAYNQLGKHALAKRVCEETIALSEEDFDYSTFTISIQLELCRAHYGLKDFAAADALLETMFERYARHQNPVTVGALHRTGAEIARARGDVLGFEHHLDRMQRCHQPTRNPALIAQYEKLRNANSNYHNQQPLQHDGTTPLTATALVSTHVHIVGDRTLRGLELVANQAGASTAQLFLRDRHNEPLLVCTWGDSTVTPPVFERLRLMFEYLPEDEEETAFIRSDRPLEQLDTHRLLPLIIVHESRRLLIGALVLPIVSPAKPLNYALLNDIALQLFVSQRER